MSKLAGMAEYCQHYYEDSNEQSEAAVMYDHNKKISEKAASLFTSRQEADDANNARQEAYLYYRKMLVSSSGKVCKNLKGTLQLLNI